MVTGKTHGFEYSVSEEKFDDMTLVEILSDVDDNPWNYGKIAEMILGKEGKENLYNAIRTEDGRIPISALSECISDIFDSYGETGKNS